MSGCNGKVSGSLKHSTDHDWGNVRFTNTDVIIRFKVIADVEINTGHPHHESHCLSHEKDVAHLIAAR